MALEMNLPESDVRTYFAQEPAPTVDLCDVDPRVVFDMLPDVALLEMFDFYVDQDKEWVEAWHTLVHVCRRWRNVVFGSPRRLNLQLFCTHSTPVRGTIDAWPLLPILVSGYGYEEGGTDNIIAAFEHNDRIRQLNLVGFPRSQTEKLLAAMQQPFPALTSLRLVSNETVPAVPVSFLGGSAPQLLRLTLESTTFPGLPKLLLSASHLVELTLWKIPHSGYFSPEAMVASLAMLTRLERFYLEFKSPRSRPDRKGRRPPLQTRTLLPSLTKLRFLGVSEYLDDLVARIDAPLLDELDITFFHQLIFDTPQLSQLISRTPKLKAYDEAHVNFSDRRVWVTTIDGKFTLAISCRQSDWQLSSLAQVCGLVFTLAVEHLYILEGQNLRPSWQHDIESGQWMEVLRPLAAVRHLYLSREFTPRIAPTLQELVGGRVTEVLPALQTLFLEEALPSGPVQEGIGKFVDARQLAGHSVAVSLWERKRFQ